MRIGKWAAMATALLITSSLPAGAEAYKCSFDRVATTVIDEAGRLQRAFDVSAEIFEFSLTNIDREKGTAQMVGNVGVADVYVFPGATGALSFVEITPSNNVMNTLILGSRGNENPAVHSRHSASFDGGIISQYLGSCDALLD